MHLEHMEEDIVQFYGINDFPASCKSVVYDEGERIDYAKLSETIFQSLDQIVLLFIVVSAERIKDRYAPLSQLLEKNYSIKGERVQEWRCQTHSIVNRIGVLRVSSTCWQALLAVMHKLSYQTFAIICDCLPQRSFVEGLYCNLAMPCFTREAIRACAAAALQNKMDFLHFIIGNDGISVNYLANKI